MRKNLIADTYIDLMWDQEMSPPIRNASPFFQCSGWNQDVYFSSYYESPIQYSSFVDKDAHGGSMHLSLTAMKAMTREVFMKCWNDPLYLHQRDALIRGFMREVDKLYEGSTYECIDQHSFSWVASRVEKMKDATWHMNAAAHFSIYFDQELCWKILTELKADISKARLDLLWKDLSFLVADSFEIRREKQILCYYLEELPDEELINKCQYFEANYSYVPGYKETLRALDDKYGSFRSRAKAVLQEREQESMRKREHFKQMCQTLSLGEKKLADYLQYIMEMRDLRKDTIGKTLAVLYRLVEPLFSDIGLENEYIYYCSYFEILRGAKYLKSVLEEIKERKRTGVSFLIPYHGSVEKQNGLFDENKKVIEEFTFSQTVQNQKDTLRGQVAFSGVVRGEVKVIRHFQKEQDSFCDGQILVTGMTRPEAVSIMKKASAIVTEEGGITCHAAIVSRELKIPCIVGTKIATKVLKDGMMVEVDAHQGTVKII